jgi:hypothetical protein
MRTRPLIALLAVLAAPAAWAQTNSTVAIPPAPAIVAAPASQPSAPDNQGAAPQPPGLTQSPAPAPAAPNPAVTSPGTVPVAPNTWVPGSTATLGVLDKVDGSTSQVSIPVGGMQNVGDLQVSVQACVNRPAGQLPDVAIFLSVQNPTDGSTAPLYRGWMVRSTPGAAVVGDASETFRVINCT